MIKYHIESMIKQVTTYKHSNKIMAFLMLVFSLSQVMADSAVCQMAMDNHDMGTHQVTMANSHAAEVDNPHAGHNMHGAKMEPTSHADMSDCCASDCLCPQGTCNSSSPIIENPTHSEFYPTATTSVVKSTLFINTNTSSALFRPPIFC